MLEPFFGKFRQDVLDAVASAITQAIVTADSQLRPAALGAAEGSIQNASHNRRHDGGLVDETMSVLRVDGTDNITSSGFMGMEPINISVNSTYWFAEGVGIVRYSVSTEGSDSGGQLTSYTVP
jgi:hypothetical protein